MSAVIDMTGQRFGKLSVLMRSERRGGLATWICRCDCGATLEVIGNNLRAGYSNSCGCSRVKHGHAKPKANTSAYTCWRNMWNRCTNPNIPTYRHYGGRGIRVCDRWLDFKTFLADMGERPSSKHSIERLNNNLGYTPENCTWATRSQQNSNRRKRSEIRQAQYAQ